MFAPAGLLESFLGAIQASLSVLLVIFYGAISAWLNLLNTTSTKAISKVSVRLFLPALLITQIGSELHGGSAHQYLLIFIWAIACHLLSFLVGLVAHLGLGMPDWFTVAVMFNNTTSYPLLLVTALDETGILQSLYGANETSKQAIGRVISYFLILATVSSCLTFAVGPRLIDSEHAPEHDELEDKNSTNEEDEESVPDAQDPVESAREIDERSTLLQVEPRPYIDVQFAEPFGGVNSFFPSNRKLSSAQQTHHCKLKLERRASIVPRKHWGRLGPRTK